MGSASPCGVRYPGTVIDINELRAHPDLFRASQKAREADESLVDRILDADAQRRTAITEFENLRAEQNAFGKKVAKAQGEEKQELLAQVKQLAADVKATQATADAAQQTQQALLTQLPNLVEEGVPSGGEEDFTVLRTEGTARFRGRRIRAERPPGNCRTARWNRHGTRGQGLRLPVLLPQA